ncbi:MAG: gamma-carboxygeranoyl-CoA hydratase [Euryarchaeota archaeon]|nr:gamma-carboxygeranoyl-CoA hydratase [Euryarchaeota archaeon]|tara:strand:- start:2928 stop:3782 length:855 start_codon:yes stop_codon:yes gene_type:complete
MENMQNPPQTELVELQIEGSTCYVTLNRQDKFNALNVQMISELCEIFEWTSKRSAGRNNILQDSDGQEYLRTLIISGHGKHFCAGADINMMRDAGAQSAEENRKDSERLDQLFNSLWSHPCFTIGLIQGVALGGGAGLIACCDYVVATENVKIALSEGKLGILPAVIGPYVYRRLGSACFRRLAMQASRIDSEEALRIGFVEKVVKDKEDLQDASVVILEEILSSGPSAVSLAKELTLEFDHWALDDEELRKFTLDFTSKMRGSDEGQEGLSSFLEKRPPNWKK